MLERTTGYGGEKRSPRRSLLSFDKTVWLGTKEEKGSKRKALWGIPNSAFII